MKTLTNKDLNPSEFIKTTRGLCDWLSDTAGDLADQKTVGPWFDIASRLKDLRHCDAIPLKLLIEIIEALEIALGRARNKSKKRDLAETIAFTQIAILNLQEPDVRWIYEEYATKLLARYR